MDCKKKKWKNLNKFCKAIRNSFSRFVSFSLSPSTSPSILSEPKSAYCPIRSRYECPCAYHSRQREEHRRRIEANFTQHHQKTAEETQVHGNVNTGILLISDGNGHDCEDKDEKNREKQLSMNDVYALVSGKSQDDAVALMELEDVDERAEKFIENFRKQLRIQTISSEKMSVSRDVFNLE